MAKGLWPFYDGGQETEVCEKVHALPRAGPRNIAELSHSAMPGLRSLALHIGDGTTAYR